MNTYLSAEALIFEDHHRRAVLLGKRQTPHRPLTSGFWALPGGHVEQGETFELTASRELKEETGISAPIHIGQIVDSFISPRIGEENAAVVTTVVHFPIWKGSPQALDGFSELRWVDLDDLTAYDLFRPAHLALVVRRQCERLWL